MLCLYIYFLIFLLISYIIIIDINMFFKINSYQILWFVWVIIPIQSIAILFSKSADPDLMKQVPSKNNAQLQDKTRIVIYYLIRFIPSMLAYLVIYLW